MTRPEGDAADTASMAAPAADDEASGLAALLARAGAGAGPRPVERWNPPDCGAIDMRIARDGTWFHEGRPIRRQALAALFASILRRDEDGTFWLVTPVEKVRIVVEDAPLAAVEVHAEGEGPAARLTFRTGFGDVVEAGEDHPLRFAVEAETGGFKPYILARGRLEALATRAVAMELADRLEPGPGGTGLGLWGGGTFFPLPDGL